MTQTPLSQEAAATKPVAAGLHKAGPQLQTSGLDLNTTRRNASV
jgi:hypothetical protein